MRHLYTRSFLLLCLIIITGCAAGPNPFIPIAKGGLYSCDYNQQIMLSIGDQSEHAAMLYNGQNISLTRTDSDKADLVYSDNIYALYYKDEIIFVEREGTPLLAGCKAL